MYSTKKKEVHIYIRIRGGIFEINICSKINIILLGIHYYYDTVPS
jgi:hypothetical protein